MPHDLNQLMFTDAEAKSWTHCPTALAVFAHPDDAELTCFGTLANLSAHGWRVCIFYVTAGESTSSQNKHRRSLEACYAAKIIGAENYSGSLRDGFASYDRQSVSLIEEKISEFEPQILVTHFPQDSGLGHQDHVEIGKAATNAALRSRTVQMVIQAEPPVLGLAFVPNLFIDISRQVENKIKAVECHASEREKRFMDRAAILDRARWWARQARLHRVGEGEFFEPFVLIKALGLFPLLALSQPMLGERV
jgi:LmbE family N-acetylglucosaminyl deacetylase